MHSGKGKVSMIEEADNIREKEAGNKRTNEPDSKKNKQTGNKKTETPDRKKVEKTGKKRGRVIKLAENVSSAGGKMADTMPDDIVFAMDIGTRTVVGVVGVQEDNYFKVIATEVSAHKNRAMLDGQIHDIEQVAVVAAGVKEKLEARLGFKLKKVAIAAAGRVLKTCQVRVDKNLEQGREIDAELVSSLEIEGIQRAQMMLDEDVAAEDKTQFYCVGYSVINYYLDGFIITRLSGHKGKNVGADVLATFLPLIVVDSLYTVMNKIGLEVSSLTLEPIAAINVTIPLDLRLLNLALVDIGAGTSDIALTKDGSVIAYAMVPLAGDEITENISQHYLVDFNTGEKIKIALSSNKGNITFTDILKIKHSVTTDEVLKAIEGTVELLASTIAQRILEYNHKAPNAIFLVGGGCRIPGLSGLIAKQLGLPADRVVVRGRDVIRDIKFMDKKLFGPESITPYGIAVTAQMYSGKDFLSVTVNERKIKLFNSKKLTVADALILFGFDASQLIGRTGKGINFTVNDEKRLIRGEYGKSAEIFLNGKLVSLDTSIAYGDNLNVIPAQDGKDAIVNACELVPEYKTGIVRLNGNPIDISTIIHINGRQSSKEMQINDGDLVKISQIKTLNDLLEAGGLDYRLCKVSVNESANYDMSYILNDGDKVICIEKKDEPSATFNVTDVMTDTTILSKTFSPAESIAAPFSTIATASPSIGQDENLQPQKTGVKVTVNGQAIILKDNRSQYIFVDIFNYIDFDLTKPQGSIVLKLNGQQAAFTDVIRSGDVIEIYWNR